MLENEVLPENNSSEACEIKPSATGSRTIRTEYDEQGRSWAVIDNYDFDMENVTEWIGGIPDTWKRR